MIIYLYIKIHNITGLKYLGKTEQDPFKYTGSGTYWRKHLKKHGNDVSTTILHECRNYNEVKRLGIYYSDLWNIVESDEWANLTEEVGQGFSSNHNKRLVDSGTHPFLGGEIARKTQINRVSKGTHPFLGGELQRKTMRQRVDAGIHNMLTEDFQMRTRQTQQKMFENGTHPFSNVKGANNINYDSTIYSFINKVTGETVNMTRNELINTYNLKSQNVYHMLKGHRKSVKGWMLREQFN